MTHSWTWLTLGALGAYHGLNPAMGWLFAVALGLQERSRGAVARAFMPIALGHALSVGAVVALVIAAQQVASPALLRWGGGGALLVFGLWKLLAPAAHPRWVGMRVGFRDLTGWSFLMSTAHGAGLMLVPVLLRLAPAPPHATEHHPHAAMADHAAHLATAGVGAPAQLEALLVHSAAMFLVMAAVALAVYEFAGLAILRRAWLNLDRVWASALVVAGSLTVALG